MFGSGAGWGRAAERAVPAPSFAPILISLSRSVVSDHCFTLGSSASRRRKLPRLYASTCSCSPHYFGVFAVRFGLEVSSTALGDTTIRDSSNDLLNDQSRTSGKDARGEWSLP